MLAWSRTGLVERVLRRERIQIQVGRDVPTPAAGVSGLEQPLARKLALDVDEIARVFTVPEVARRKPADVLTKERIHAQGRARGGEDAGGVGIRQVRPERQPQVVRLVELSGLREAVLHDAADDERHRVDADAAAQHGFRVQLVREPDARLEVVPVRVPEAGLAVRCEQQPADRVERRHRQLCDRVGRVGRFRRRRDGEGRIRVESVHVPVVDFRRRPLVLVTEPEVDGETVRDLPVVLNEHAVVHRVVQPLAVAVDASARRLPEKETGVRLPEQGGGIVLEPRVVCAENVVAARAAEVGGGFLVQPPVVAHAHGVAAHDAGQRRLERVDAVRRRAGEVVAEPGEAADVDERKVLRSAEEGDDVRREPERGRVDQPFVLPDARLLEALPAGADVEGRISS